MTLQQLNEMSLITDDFEGYPMLYDFQQEFKTLKLIKDKIPPLNNKLYSGQHIFYLTDEKDNYLGHLEYSFLDTDTIKIDSTYSSFRGFYELLFKLIFVLTPIKMIFGGSRQSPRAISSWKKRLEKFHKKVYNTETKQVEEFDDSKENLYWTKDDKLSKKYLVGLSESDNFIKNDYIEIEQLLETKRNHGKVGMPVSDILVRFYRLNVDEVQEILEVFNGNYFIGNYKSDIKL